MSHSSSVVVVGLERHEHLLGHALRRLVTVERLDDAVDHPAWRQRLDLVEHEPLAPHDPALAHEEHLHGRFEFVVREPDHVDILVAVGHHLLALDRPPHGRQPITHVGRPLVLHLVGGPPHLGLEAVDDVVGVAVEEVAQLGDELAIGHLVYLADARPAALLDVEQQARPPQPLVLAELPRAARADRERPQQQIERVADRVGVGVGPEVAGAGLLESFSQFERGLRRGLTRPANSSAQHVRQPLTPMRRSTHDRVIFRRELSITPHG